MPAYAVALLSRLYPDLDGATVAVLGASYRGGVKETAFSGVFPTVEALLAVGARPVVHDPMFSDEEIQRCLSHWQRIESMLPQSAEPSEAPPREIVREAIEENTGENFTFVERLYALDDFEPDLQPSEVSLQTRALADVCLVLMNSNEFVYVY